MTKQERAQNSSYSRSSGVQARKLRDSIETVGQEKTPVEIAEIVPTVNKQLFLASQRTGKTVLCAL